jgi:hypothetical protein
MSNKKMNRDQNIFLVSVSFNLHYCCMELSGKMNGL